MSVLETKAGEKMKKLELISKIKEEMNKNYVNFKNLDGDILPDYRTEWEQAVDNFYKNYKGGLSEFQEDWNMHCIFLDILQQKIEESII